MLESRTGLEAHLLWEDPLMIVSTSAKTSVEALKGPMIGLSAGIPLQTYIDAHLERDGITPNYRVCLPTLSAVYAVASTGGGSAILPLGTTRRLGVRTKNVLPIEEPWAQRDAWILVKEGRTLDDVEKSFIDALLSFRDEES